MKKGELGQLLMEVYHRLLERYGPQGWWPGDSAFETVIGAILTQNTAWSNVEKALASMKKAGIFSPEKLRTLPEEELASLIRSSGYFITKAKKLKAFVYHLERYGDDLQAFFAKEVKTLREELLGIYGIGEETADDILLYAADKPSFVIDAYTHRILQRLGIAPSSESYTAYQQLFQEQLPQEVTLYNEYHALLDRHGLETCRKSPLCHRCCLLDLCPTGKERSAHA